MRCIIFAVSSYKHKDTRKLKIQFSYNSIIGETIIEEKEESLTLDVVMGHIAKLKNISKSLITVRSWVKSFFEV